MRLVQFFCLLGLALVSTVTVQADTVEPTNEVVTRVIVREGASTQVADVGSLRPGDQAELLESVPNWYRIRLTNGTEGFVSKRWTRVISTAISASFTIDVVDVGT